MNHCTWRDQRLQYGRAIAAGMTPEEAKQTLPRCGKCLTLVLRSRRAQASLTAHS
jgi:hypothetical protein